MGKSKRQRRVLRTGKRGRSTLMAISSLISTISTSIIFSIRVIVRQLWLNMNKLAYTAEVTSMNLKGSGLRLIQYYFASLL